MSEVRRSTREPFNSFCHRPTQKHTDKGILYLFCVLLPVLLNLLVLLFNWDGFYGESFLPQTQFLG